MSKIVQIKKISVSDIDLDREIENQYNNHGWKLISFSYTGRKILEDVGDFYEVVCIFKKTVYKN